MSLLLAAAIAAVAAGGRDYPSCKPEQLSLAFDGENGAFDGMSHSGTLLVIRNLGPVACRLPRLPQLTFRDAASRVLPIARQVPPGMHPGPVVRPIAVAAGAEITASLRWVSGQVYDHGRCLGVASVAVALDAGELRGALKASMCGPAGKAATIEQLMLKPDPVLGAVR